VRLPHVEGWVPTIGDVVFPGIICTWLKLVPLGRSLDEEDVPCVSQNMH